MSTGNMLPELTQVEDSFPISVPAKSEIPANAKTLCDTLLERMAPKEAYVYLYARVEVESAAMEVLKEKVIVTLRGIKEEVFGATVEMRSKPKKYQYQDGRLEVLYAQLENLKREIKEREKFNQSLPPEGMVDPKTGEKILPPIVEEQGVTLAVKLAGGGR